VATRIGGNINAYNIANDGSLTTIAGQPFATGETDTKALALTPDGKRMYVSSDTGNNVTGFNVGATGSLSEIVGSPWATGSVGVPDLESIVITPNQPPAAAFSASAAPQGQATSFNGGASADTDGGSIATYRWDFGDGTSQIGGPTTAHVYGKPGTYLSSLTVTDNEGCSSQRIFTGKATLCNGSAIAGASRTIVVGAASPSTPPTTTPGRDTTAPRFLSGKVSPSTFAVDPRGAAERVVSSVAKGTTLSYSLSEPARVVFTVDRKTTGRRVGRGCRKPTRANRRNRSCTLLLREGRFARLSGGGANIKRFSGRLGRKSLRLASYQLTFDARDNAGNRARPLIRGFKIVSR
jgi:PKD repeat protein